jgi:hypothetical protein
MANTTSSENHALVWRGREFEYFMDELTNDILEAVAEGVAIQTMENIRAKGLIDTRFMENSTYYVTQKESTYETLLPDALYRSSKTGQMVRRVKAPKTMPSRPGEVIVGNAAPYFIFQEIKHGVMFKAFQEIADEVETTAKVKYTQKAR